MITLPMNTMPSSEDRVYAIDVLRHALPGADRISDVRLAVGLGLASPDDNSEPFDSISLDAAQETVLLQDLLAARERTLAAGANA